MLSSGSRYRLGLAAIQIQSLTDGTQKLLEPKELLNSASMARYVPSGHLIYHKAGELFAAPFDLERLRITGSPEVIVRGVAFNAITGMAQFDVSRNGTLVYRSRGGQPQVLSVKWIDRTGGARDTVIAPGNYARPSLSPDGARLGLAVSNDAGPNIWTYDLRRGTRTQITFDGKSDAPVWTPDGRFLVFRILSGGTGWIRSDGASASQVFIASKNDQFPWSFSAHHRRIAFMERHGDGRFHIWTAPVESTASALRVGKPEPFFHTPDGDERHPSFSPDGRWLAYTSDESGISQIWVRPFPPNPSAGRWQISQTGGRNPNWSQDGREIFFRTEDNQIMVASYAVQGDSFVSENPRVWTQTELADIGPVANYDLAPDGKRIIALMDAAPVDQKADHHVVFLLNFFDELRRRFPVRGQQ